MKLLLSSLFLFLLLVTLSASAQSASPVSETVLNWSAEASLAKRKQQPIMLLFTSPDCHYCDQLEQELIAPMLRDGSLSEQVHLRKFSTDRGGKLVDFDGEKVRARLFVSRYHVFATPTVILVDYQGYPLSEPIVGYNGATRYLPLLQRAIDRASAYPAIQARTRPDPVH